LPARNEGTEVAGAHRGDEGRHRFCLLVFSVRCATGVSTPCLCMCVLVGPRLGRRRAEDPKRRKRGDNSREHPTGDCRLAARWGRREVEGKSPSPVSSRESQRRDDAVLRATAAREVKGYSSCICQAGQAASTHVEVFPGLFSAAKMNQKRRVNRRRVESRIAASSI
jgi:hypothetical protein